MKYNGAVITPQDFKKEIEKRDNALLERIASSKSVNKQWLATINGFDADYISGPVNNMNE